MKHMYAQTLLVGGCLLTLLAGCGSDCDSFIQEAVNNPATETASISLRFDDGTPYDYEGVQVFVDGVEVGVTGAGGLLDYTFADDNVHEIRALHAGTSQGIIFHDASSSASTILIPMSGDLGRPARLSVEQIQGAYLAQSTTTAIDLQMQDSAGVPVDFASVLVIARDAKASTFGLKDVTDLFSIDAPGSLSLQNVPEFFSEIEEFVNDVAISVRGVDTDGATVASAKNFFFGQHTLDITLEAPPSSLGLDVTGLEVSARLVGTDIWFTGTTDAVGAVSIADLPTGTYDILVESELDGEFYTAAHVHPVDGDGSLGLVVLGLSDVLAGVSVVSTSTTTSTNSAYANFATDQGLRSPSFMGDTPHVSDLGTGTGIMVSGGAEDEIVVAFKEFIATEGTETLGVTFEVVSEEYPEFVEQQAGASDTWSVRVYGPLGKLLYSSARTVNSQVRGLPVWIPGTDPGTTGIIPDEVSLADLPMGGDHTVYLVITSSNIGDDLNPTTVFADIQDSRFLMKSISVDAVTPDFECGVHSQIQGKRSDQFSIPYEGLTNTVQRQLLVDLIGRPDGLLITNVSVDLIEAGTKNILTRVVDEGPSEGGRVQHLTDEDGHEQLLLMVTSDAENLSTVPDLGTPALDRFEYLITIMADDATSLESGAGSGSGSDYQTALATPVLQALWKADLPERTGCRESGGDDWAARVTVEWLNANAGVIPPVDDISGEHNRNLGHLDSAAAKSIHVRQFPSPLIDFSSGLRNYIALRDDVRQAFEGDTAALARVDEWFTANRNGFAGIAAAGGVTRINIASSPADDILPANWFFDLFTQGTITNGKEDLDLPSGPWTHPYAGRLRAEGGLLDQYHLKLF